MLQWAAVKKMRIDDDRKLFNKVFDSNRYIGTEDKYKMMIVEYNLDFQLKYQKKLKPWIGESMIVKNSVKSII